MPRDAHTELSVVISNLTGIPFFHQRYPSLFAVDLRTNVAVAAMIRGGIQGWDSGVPAATRSASIPQRERLENLHTSASGAILVDETERFFEHSNSCLEWVCIFSIFFSTLATVSNFDFRWQSWPPDPMGNPSGDSKRGSGLSAEGRFVVGISMIFNTEFILVLKNFEEKECVTFIHSSQAFQDRKNWSKALRDKRLKALEDLGSGRSVFG